MYVWIIVSKIMIGAIGFMEISGANGNVYATKELCEQDLSANSIKTLGNVRNECKQLQVIGR